MQKSPRKQWDKLEGLRSKTPDVQIIQSQRQMHSLTARSLSKEFRDGLRQIPNQVSKSPCNPIVISKQKSNDPLMEEIRRENHSHNKGLNGATSEKLKNNIQFWEKLQKQI